MKVRNVRKLILAAAVAALSIGATGTASAATLTLGNYSENILNGGVLATDGSAAAYYANTEKGNYLYKGSKQLTSESAENINVIDGYVYYTNGSSAYRITTSGGSKTQVVKANTDIDEMYVDGQNNIYYLAGGSIYKKGADDSSAAVIDRDGSIRHFIPTEYGMIKAKGSARNYTIYAGSTKIAGGVTSFRTYEQYLLMSMGGKDKQVRIRDLFNNFTVSDITNYDLGDGIGSSMAADVFADTDECDICDENAEHAAADGVQKDDFDLEVSASTASGVVSTLNSSSVSNGQRNMVLRARQQHEVKWTPQKNITGWGGSYTFQAGTTYSGLPYGQPVKAKYVPWSASLEEFVQAVNDPSSLMYTSRSTYNRTAPYYSTDCSGFVSWAWNLPSRQYTGSIGGYATQIAGHSLYSMEIGDAFVYSGHHVVMVSDIGYQGDEIVYIDIIEQTPPSTKLTRYGLGGSKTLAELTNKYFVRNNYVIIRSKTRDDVKYTPSKVVSLDGDQSADTVNYYVTLDQASDLQIGESQKLNMKTNVSGAATWTSSNTAVAAVTSSGYVKGIKAGTATITVKVGGFSDKITVAVGTAAPALKTIKTSTAANVKITWSAVSGAERYYVYRKTPGSGWKPLGSTTLQNYKDKTAERNTVYYYTVRGAFQHGNQFVQGAYVKDGIGIKTPTTAPALGKITADGNSQTFSWKEVAGADGYRVYVRKNGGKWVLLDDTDTTAYTYRGLSVGSSYCYTVRAFVNFGGQKILSGYNSKGIAAVLKPAAPEKVNITSPAAKTISMNWSRVSGADGYRVYRKVGGKWKLLKTVKTTSFTEKNLKNGKKYLYAVTAYVKVGSKTIQGSYKKNTYGYVGLAAPELKSATSPAAGKATLSWGAVNGAKGYVVYRRAAGTNKWTKVGATKKVQVTMKKLESGTAYAFTVRAYYKSGNKALQGLYNKEGISVTVQ